MPGGRVLLAEDHHDSRDLLALALRGDGHDVVETVDGMEAMARFTAMNAVGVAPHVIITDMFMPHASGLTFVSGLRAIGITSPILVVTAYDNEELRRRAHRLNVEVWRKPVDLEALRAKVLQLVAG
jgi:CheY-like chemotaxis protein